MRWCLPILITILSSAPAEAQYLFSLLQTKDGLSSNTVTSILQDSDGFIWIGTLNGINRFDGSSIKAYNWANKNYPLYLSEGIRCMAEKGSGKFLVSTRNGMTWFSAYNNKFEKVIYGPEMNPE